VTWQRAPVAAAVAAVLTAASEGAVTVFADPPASFNVPAYVVAWPSVVTYHSPTFGVDIATLPVLACVATDQSAQCDALLGSARAAFEADPTLGGTLTHGVVVVTEERNWRILADVSGARFLAAQLTLEIRM
jgi:hypothetical protein